MPRAIHIPNGENIVHTFSDKEYQNRQRKLREHMAQSNVDTSYLYLYPWY
jgi:creatinase